MNKTLKIIIALVVVLAIIFIGYALITKNNNKQVQIDETKEPIKIGVITPLTGPASEYGLATKRGLDLAVEEINNIDTKIELVYEDSQCDPQKALSALQKMTSINKINVIIGTVCSSVTLALAPVVQEKNLLIISSGSSNPNISKYSNIFRTWPSDALQGEFLASFVKDVLGLKKIGILYINNDYGVGLKDAFSKKFGEKDGIVVLSEAIPESVSDARTQILKMKTSDLDGVFLATFAKEMGVILKQSQELNFITKFFAGEGFKDVSVVEVAGKGAEGLIGTVPSTSKEKTFDNFVKKFNNKYNDNPGITSDSAYDIPFLLKEVYALCSNTLDVDCLKKELINLDNFNGASGYINFDENGDVIDKSYDLFKIENGEFVEYK